MSAKRLFVYVFFAVLAVDLGALVGTRAGPDVWGANGLGRAAICLAAGWAMGRMPAVGRAAASTFVGVIAATLITVSIYIVTGLAVEEANGPQKVYALLVLTAAIAIVSMLVGLVLSWSWRRLDRARAT
ncbi:MAG TPA: hypothetical protein VFJ82_04240 [Longimicrobium sp.]|nr:hypothetical protein [Longimicrobium sp.]